jgi:ATP-dependent protease ClpP protease subunit
MDHIIKCKIPIYTVVDGICASAATFLTVVGKRRFINPHSFMLIHQLSSGFWGNYSEFRDHQRNLDLLMSTITGVYRKYTKLPETKLKSLMKHDLLLDAKQCLKYGLVDEIL